MKRIAKKVYVWIDLMIVWPVLLYRYCQFGYTFRRIYLGEGYWTILEQADYYRLKDFKWILYGNDNNLYAMRHRLIGPNKTMTVYMHREIMNPPVGLVVDHRNCDGLDNRKSNLRLATHVENMHNRRKKKNASSRFLGVSIAKGRYVWVSQLMHKGKVILIGRFKTEIEAAKAYDEAAKKYFGEFARLNFPPDSVESRALFARMRKKLDWLMDCLTSTA